MQWDLEDDDEPITSSFTKSKMEDDDDDKLKNKDNDWTDFLFKNNKKKNFYINWDTKRNHRGANGWLFWESELSWKTWNLAKV